MYLPKSQNFFRSFATSRNWRTQIEQNQLASQISSTLLQRRNWVSLLRNLNLDSKLTPSLFLRILLKIQTHPQTSLGFFHWAKSTLGFQPDLKSHCHIIRIAVGSGLYPPAKPLVDSLIREYPASAIAETMVTASKGTSRDSLSVLLSFVIERYSQKGLFMEGLEAFRLMRLHGCTPTVRSCNALLDALQRENKVQLGWCLYGALIRFGYRLGRSTLSIVAQILSKNGKFDTIGRLLDSGIYDSKIYNLVIGGYSDKGDFKSAFDALNQMSTRKLTPDFVTYSSILDGACKLDDVEVLERIINIMAEKGLLPKCSSSFNYDLAVQKLSDIGKTYAAEMFFRRSCDENNSLQDVTYGCLLRTLSKERRIREAISVYAITSQRGLALDYGNYQAFFNFLCEEDQCAEVEGFELLKDIIRRGFDPSSSNLSKFTISLCNKGRWREAEDLLGALLDRGIVPDSSFCSLLMKHYCNSRQVDSAIELHYKMEKLNATLDVAAYNVFLNRLFVARKTGEAVQVFNYIRRQDLLSSESFTIMIRELCKVKELRKAMKLHDEMLRIGLKPDKPTYKRLISGFA
ncbi:pentatricopeptide repeat-containing protein At4g21170-like [Neltuma alba]|uniref:pentatricopeptide repeat-containing protein At4g21170-like n=1 Tax=Neltuma alba TaxID=207710 RepID=UPI0010A2BFE2|nr:pentatricopeptide repeat-containing protein At4g21170-like [Prosopis alba]